MLVDQLHTRRLRYGRGGGLSKQVEALLKKNVRADALYSHVEADPGSAEARNRRTAA